MTSGTCPGYTVKVTTLVALVCLLDEFGHAYAAPDKLNSSGLAQFDFLLGTHRCQDVFTKLDVSRLIFERPTDTTFKWRSEYHMGERVFVDWTSDCQRTTD